MEGYFQLGYIRKKHGFKGDVVLHLESDHPERYASLDVLFMEDSDSPIPFFISSMRTHKKDEYILKLEGVSTEDEASRLVGQGMFLPEEILPELNPDQFYYHEIIGYKAFDDSFEGEMKVIDVLDRPSQPLISLSHPGKENPILIPLVEGFWKSIDKKSQSIYLSAPRELYEL